MFAQTETILSYEFSLVTKVLMILLVLKVQRISYSW